MFLTAGCFYPLSAMATKRQFGWRKLFLILTVLPCCRSLEVSIPQKEYEVARGGNITLTCSFIPAQPDAVPAVLTWEAFADNPTEPMKPVASFFSTGVINIAPGYEGRVSVEYDNINHVSTLHLTKVIMQDSRRYQCGVLIPNDDEGTTAAITSLLVLVAPSVPICSIQGKAEYGHNISLTCMSEEGSPKPTYKWASYSVKNVPRDLPPRSSEKDGVLSLYNISREMSGFYICTSTNRIGSASYNLTLAVLPGSVGEASIAVVIGGVVAGLVLLGILIFCCCRKKGKKNKSADRDVQFFDRDESEAGEEYWDDMSHSETKKHKPYEDKGAVPQNNYIAGPDRHKLDDDQHSYSGKETIDAKGSYTDSQRNQDDQHDDYRGSRDRLDDQRDRYGGSRDRLDDQRDRYGGSRDRLDDKHNYYSGSRDRLDDQRDRYGGSRDRLDDQRDRYGGSRDRLDDRRDRYGGSRDRLDDQRDRYGGSRDRLDDQRDRYGGSRDRLDDRRDRYGASDRDGRSRDRPDDQRDRYDGSRDRVVYKDDQYRN